MPIHPAQASTRTVVLSLILVPVIVYFFYFAHKKNIESTLKTEQCRQECATQGYSGYDFKWVMLSEPQYTCLAT